LASSAGHGRVVAVVGGLDDLPAHFRAGRRFSSPRAHGADSGLS
jgi:hypothetical protein